MKAVTWQGVHDMRVIDVPDPRIEEPTDAIIKVTSTALCGSDLHLYETLGPFMDKGDVLGHEPMGIVEEVGSAVTNLKVGDRVVVPFNVCCGTCWMCERHLYSQCETTQNHEHGTGASFFGYSKLYGQVPGGQAEYLRVPFADFLPVKVPHEHADDRFLFLSDVLPTAWQAVEYAACPYGGTLLVLGLGPIGDMATRIARHRGLRVIAVDLVPERLARARARGAEVIDLGEVDSVGDAVRDLTAGRGADAVIDAVGMEAHGSPVGTVLHRMTNLLPKAAVLLERRRRHAVAGGYRLSDTWPLEGRFPKRRRRAAAGADRVRAQAARTGGGTPRHRVHGRAPQDVERQDPAAHPAGHPARAAGLTDPSRRGPRPLPAQVAPCDGR